jgi:DNA-binding transcriptional ArsR family regulator
MDTMPFELLLDPERVRIALTPVRRQLLESLREPASASMLAARLGLPRQRLSYHLRVLEDAGLVMLLEERQRRGFVERVLVARADAFLVDPSLMGPRAETLAREQDRFAADHLLATAADLVADVGRMQAAAAGEGRRLLTFTIEAEVTLGRPADLQRYAERLARAVSEVSEEFSAPAGRRYRVVVGGHPARQALPHPTVNQEADA